MPAKAQEHFCLRRAADGMPCNFPRQWRRPDIARRPAYRSWASRFAAPAIDSAFLLAGLFVTTGDVANNGLSRIGTRRASIGLKLLQPACGSRIITESLCALSFIGQSGSRHALLFRSRSRRNVHRGPRRHWVWDLRRNAWLAMSFLAEVACDENGKKNERMLRTIVRDGSGTGVYEAILTLTGRPL